MSVAVPVIDRLDLATRHIYLKDGVRTFHPVTDIYHEVRNLRRVDETLRIFDIPVTAEGAVPKGGGKFTPRYAVFHNGWAIVPEDTGQTLYVTGEMITSDGQAGEFCFDLDPITCGNVVIQYDPPSAELIKLSEDTLSSGWTIDEAYSIVMAALAGKLSGADTDTIVIRDVNDTKDVITATVDEHGNRTTVVLTP